MNNLLREFRRFFRWSIEDRHKFENDNVEINPHQHNLRDEIWQERYELSSCENDDRNYSEYQDKDC